MQIYNKFPDNPNFFGQPDQQIQQLVWQPLPPVLPTAKQNRKPSSGADSVHHTEEKSIKNPNGRNHRGDRIQAKTKINIVVYILIKLFYPNQSPFDNYTILS